MPAEARKLSSGKWAVYNKTTGKRESKPTTEKKAKASARIKNAALRKK